MVDNHPNMRVRYGQYLHIPMDTLHQLIYVPPLIGQRLSVIATNQYNWDSNKEQLVLSKEQQVVSNDIAD